MKLSCIALATLMSATTATSSAGSQESQPLLKGDYLGQNTPGLTPQVFAPNVVSTKHRDFSGFFSPDMRSFYFTRKLKDQREWSLIEYTQNAKGEWQLASTEPRVGRPILSPDGNTMHLGKHFKTRTDNGWSELQDLGEPYSTTRIMRLMSSAKGTYVYDEGTRDGSGKIRISTLVDGVRQEPQELPIEINGGSWNAHPFIAPDESYLIWDGERRVGYGDNDLYISFKNADGSWGEGINLGSEINTDAQENGAIVTPDGKYLFFNRGGGEGDGDIYWVSTDAFMQLKLRDNDNTSPKATKLESQITGWSVPEIKRNFWHLPQLPKAWVKTDNAALEKLAQEIENKQHNNIDGLVIAQKGDVLFEGYFSRGRIDLPHPQSSTTKAYAALALGRAITLGYLSMADLDKPVVSLLPGLNPETFAEGVERITLNDLLNMNSGLSISDETMDKYDEQPEQYAGIKQIQAYFEDTAPITGTERTFNYQGVDPIIAMYVVDSAIKGSSEQFIKDELFGKLGITQYKWRATDEGIAAGESGSSVTTRDMLKVGALVANNGKVNGEQLINAEFIELINSPYQTLTNEQSDGFYSGDNLSAPAYSYLWWPLAMQSGDKTYQVTTAQGAGGVSIVVIDELDVVIAITGHSQEAFLQMIAERVIPAITAS